MGRRSDHKREELQEMAIVSAWNIMESDGQGALTVRKVAADLGYSVGTIYNLFENLDELSLRVKVRVLDGIYEEFLKVDISHDPETNLFNLFEVYFRYTGEHASLWKSIFERLDTSAGALPSWYSEAAVRPFAIVETVLKPLFDKDDEEGPATAARVIWGGVHGIASLAAGEQLNVVSGENGEGMARDLVQKYIAGVKAK